jgi:hypothetical protein
MLFSDFYFFYAAAKMVAVGGNPYIFEDYYHYLLSVGGSTGHRFPYPVWSIGVIYPLGFWDFTTSLVVLTALSIFLCCAVAFHLIKQINPEPSLSQIKIILYTCSFMPLLKILLFGQVSWIVFVAIGASLWLVEKQRFFWAGAVISLASIKPHISAPIILFFLTSNLLAKNRGFLPGLIAGLSLQVVSSFLLLELPVADYLALISPSPHNDQQIPILTSAPLGWLTQIISQELVNLFAVVLGGLVGVYSGKHLPLNTESVFLVLAPVALLIAPYSYSHDFLLLLPLAVATIFKFRGKLSERASLYCWAAWMIAMAYLIMAAEWALWLIFIPVIPLAAQTYANFPAQSPCQDDQ